MKFTAYKTQPPHLPLVAAKLHRPWMDATPNKLAYRCLPMDIANQAGWLVLHQGRSVAVWNGGSFGPDDVQIKSTCPIPPIAHFGSGVITWRIPYLFHTESGWNTLMRGPANLPKHGISPLEGIVESDWSPQTPFMSWKITKPNVPIVFEDGEPICMVLPVKRGELEAVEPVLANLYDNTNPELLKAYEDFSRARIAYNASERGPHDWQKDYHKGTTPGADKCPVRDDHQVRLALKEFK